MTTDLTFFTNEPDLTLLDRFRATLADAQYFDVLVGYFRTSGFRLMAEAMESAEKIRILVGLNVDRQTFEGIEAERAERTLHAPSEAARTAFIESVADEMAQSPDTYEIEQSVKTFLDFLQDGKLEIRAHPDQKIHAKVYIQRFHADDRDVGRVITGSSNFSYSGLIGNYEFNVELKNSADVRYALEKFEELWAEGVDVSEQYAETIHRDTWLNNDITPHQLYLKLLYEYFKEELSLETDVDLWLPDGFLSLEYQAQAVHNALRVLDTYNGVFLADVVGLGKTFISALLAQQLPGRKLIVCPPVLVDYWRETFRDFGVRSFYVESIGKLDQLLRGNYQKYDYIFIDEAHRFRNEMTQRYEKLARLCAGKKTILVSATPLNNKIEDIYAQLKLFQPPRNSIIPGVRNLETFFEERRKEIARYDRHDPEYVPVLTRISNEIRDRILRHVMVRRTRSQIRKHFADDIARQGLTFPTLADPHRLIYRFDDTISAIFDETLTKLTTFHYARYTPLLYLKTGISGQLRQGQRNVGAFMRMVLVKRLESSFYAFRRTLERFIDSYERFIEMVEAGSVLIGSSNILDLLDVEDDAKLQAMLDEGEIEAYDSNSFKPSFMQDLQADRDLLLDIYGLWSEIEDDPKRAQLVDALQHDPVLGHEKVIVFSESAETTHYLFDQLNAEFPEEVIAFTSAGARFGSKTESNGASSIQTLGKEMGKLLILNNFDPKAENPSDDIRILITTDVLAEGINLHRSPAVVNYDLPWNPTRVLQRVGRINRVGTRHNTIHVYNFFPTDQSDEQLGLEANIKSKIQAFHNMLGEDAKYLSDEEELVEHDLRGSRLVERLSSRDTYEADGEEERSELDYLEIIRDVRDHSPELFEQIKRMPAKARAGWRAAASEQSSGQAETLTFFRQGRVKKFFVGDVDCATELTFFDAIDRLACEPETPREPIPPIFYEHLLHNKIAFKEALVADSDDLKAAGGKYEGRLRTYLRMVRRHQTFTDADEAYVQQLLDALDDGRLPTQTVKRAWQSVEKMRTAATRPLTALTELRRLVPYDLLIPQQTTQDYHAAKREIILSAYLLEQAV